MITNSNDIISFLSCLSYRKCINFLQVKGAYYYSRLAHKQARAGVPYHISIEPCSFCNLTCLECPTGQGKITRPKGSVDLELYNKIIDEIRTHVIYLMLYFQGEPYMHPDFFTLIRDANERNIYTVASTNGHFLDKENARNTVESKLNRLIISIDGSTQEAYSQYRSGGSLDKVTEGIKNIVEYKESLQSKTPYILLQFLVTRSNQHQTDAIKKLGKNLGVNGVAYKSIQINDFSNADNLLPSIDKYSRYSKLPDGSYKIKRKEIKQCYRIRSGSVITWDGDIIPCCFDKDASYKLGNINDTSLKYTYKSKRYAEFIRDVEKRPSTIEMCSNCTEGLKT